MPRTFGKTIQIFMPDGSPTSYKIAEITTRIVQLILIPRNKLTEMGNREEVNNVGVYFLFGRGETDNKASVYIGEAENCFERLKQHNRDSNKDFWNVAILAVTKTSSFTKSHVKFLESFCYQEAKKVDRYNVVNGNTPTQSRLSEPMVADLMDNFDTMKTLLSALGYPIFERVANETSEELLYCKGKDALARGEYTDEGFVVFKDSVCNLEEAASAGTWVINARKELIENNILFEEGNILKFKENHIFNSPSAAAVCVLARRANGWTEWKNKAGKTLDELKRQE
ncbi:GIY-YIG nuclease family protein [Salipaludibacillus sp. CUR1]|uniref:GIY-YIG nuclease family protein n=1 Tax=Salipaludibacillus sp. CUR1 TaxID=2820003 RepID=UPI001E28F602|nr:GIY-YIG nuclease family protein [Salipaludibacillus sp. CUR1]MCE7792207.1 GIY-YIG nuclease family protein [Salipaludibacillus sp. CUR1]